MKHLTDEQLGARLDGELPARQAEAAERHLAACGQCRERLAALAGSDTALARALHRDPGEAYFASFADRVQARLAAGAGAESRESPADAAPRRGWFGSPATLAWAGAAASLVLVGVFAVQFATQQSSGSRRAGEPPSVVGSAVPARDAAEQQTATPAPDGARANEAPSAPSAEAGAGRADEPSARVPAASGARATLADGGPRAAGAAAQDERAAQARRGAVAPQRLQELRTLPNGEQVPVQTRALPQPDKRKAFAVPPADASRPRKPVAQPLAPREQLKQSTTTQELNSRAGAEEARTGVTAAPAPLSAAAPAPEAGNFVSRREAEAIATFRLCGTVANAQGRTLEGATVTVVETGRSVVSGAAGAFCVDAPSPGATLSVLALGYHEYRATVRGADAAGPLAVSLRAVETVGTGGAPVARLKTEPPPVVEGKAVPELDVSAKRGVTAWGETRSSYLRPPASRPAPAPDAATARAASEAARLAKSPSLWSKAGALWTGVAAVAKSATEADEARFRAAEARMNAWRLAPGGVNRAEALAAIDAFVAKAPAGARRDTAEAWRRELPAR